MKPSETAVTLRVEDFKSVKKFYSEGLGCPIDKSFGSFATFTSDRARCLVVQFDAEGEQQRLLVRERHAMRLGRVAPNRGGKRFVIRGAGLEPARLHAVDFAGAESRMLHAVEGHRAFHGRTAPREIRR